MSFHGMTAHSYIACLHYSLGIYSPIKNILVNSGFGNYGQRYYKQIHANYGIDKLLSTHLEQISLLQVHLILYSKVVIPFCLPIMTNNGTKVPAVHISSPVGVVSVPDLSFPEVSHFLNIFYFVHVPCIEHTFLHECAIHASSLLSVEVVNFL